MRWWRVFIDKCKTWPKFVELFTGDVSEGGLFVPTEQQAAPGENVEIELSLPDAVSFVLTGTVANVISADRAAQFGKRQGLGIKLESLAGDDRERFDLVLSAARAADPIPELLARLTPAAGVPIIATAPPTTTTQPQSPSPPSQPPATPKPRASPPPIPRPPSPPPPRSPPPAPAGPIVGIDLGTTFTSIAAIMGNKVTILARDDGHKSTASVIAIMRDGEVIVGPAARERIATDPAHTIASPKRLLGRPYNEREVQTFVNHAPYRTTAGPDGSTTIHIYGQEYAIPQLCAFLLSDIKELAERRLGMRVDRAVISVPISFDDHRISALYRAARMANLEIVAVIDEPSAAALANRFDPHFGGLVGVYDFGGGTFDFSIVDVSRGDFKVLATAGDTWLGGDDFDSALGEAAANQFWREHKVDLRRQAVEWQRLLFACEKAKRELSGKESAVIKVADVLRTADGMVDLELKIDRPTLARACKAIIQRSMDTCDEALGLLDLRPKQLTCVYLSGGTTYIPAVREAIAAHFGVPVRTGVPPQHAVCLGAAVHAAQLQLSYTPTLDAR